MIMSKSSWSTSLLSTHVTLKFAQNFLQGVLLLGFSQISFSAIEIDPRYNGWVEGFYWELSRTIGGGAQPSLRKYPGIFYSQAAAFTWVENLVYEDTRGSFHGKREFGYWWQLNSSYGQAFFSGSLGQIWVFMKQCQLEPNEKFCVNENPYTQCWPDHKSGRCINIPLLKEPRTCSTSGHPTPTTGNPIIIATGNKYQQEIDYQSQKPFGLSFVRYYNSSAYDAETDIGIKWRHNFSRRIDTTSANALVNRGNGQAFVFNKTVNSWQADADISDTLIERLDENNQRTGWLYTTSNDIVEQYNELGQIILITNRADQTHTFFYKIDAAEGGDDNDLTLDKVIDSFGGKLLLSYDIHSRIIRMTDPEGQHTHYSYDAQGNLSRVSYADDTVEQDNDNPARTYHYEHTSLIHHLTGITDETGQRYVTWDYDEQGRGIRSESAGNTSKSTLVYHDDDSVTVTNPLGKKTTYHFVTLHQIKKLTQVTGHASESCGGAHKTYTYDQNGYLQSKTDWQGNLITYSYNDRGLQLSRTEASGTPAARTTTTEWHSDFRLPIKITQPGKVTEYHYDDNGHLLSQTTKNN